MNTDPVVGWNHFTDGATRGVFADAEGQHVLDGPILRQPGAKRRIPRHV
jgi:hypothetical protein